MLPIFKNLTIKGFGLDNWLNGTCESQKSNMLKELISIISKPEFKMPISQKYALEEYSKAIGNGIKNQSKGKTLFWLESE